MAETKLLLEPTDTVAEKVMNKPQSYQSPLNFDFYGKNFVKDKEGIMRLESQLRSDIVLKVTMYENAFFPKWIQAIKDYVLSTVDRAIELRRKGQTFRTNEKQPLIRKYVDSLVQAIFRANFTIKAYAATEDGFKRTKAIQRFIEWGFFSSKAKQTLIDMATTAILLGPGFARSGFDLSREKVAEVKDPLVKNIFDISDAYPKFEWVSEFCLFGEPFVPFHEQRDMIYRKILPLKTVMQKMAALNAKLSKDHLRYILRSPKPVSYKNYDKARLIKYFEDYVLGSMSFTIDNVYQLTLDNNHCEYIERWTDQNLVILINGYIVYDGKNPRKNGGHPFKAISFTRQPGTWISDGVGTLLAGQQRLYDALYNISFDLMKFNAGPMFLLQQGQHIEGNEKFLNYEPFSFLQIHGPGKIERMEMPQMDPGVAKGMADILEMANFTIGPSNYNQVQGTSRSATDSNMRSESLKDSVLSLMDSMNTMLNEVAAERIMEAKTKMPNSFKVPVFGKDGGIQEREKITQKDLEYKYLFQRDSESLKDINKTIERTQMTEFINAVNAFGTDPLKNRWLLDNEKLISDTLDLFNKDPSILLTDKQYLDKMKKAQEEAQKMQQELQLPGGEQQQGENAPSPEQAKEILGGQLPPNSSEININPEAQQEGIPQAPQTEPVGIANVMKGALE